MSNSDQFMIKMGKTNAYISVIGFYQTNFYSCEMNRNHMHNVILPMMWVATNYFSGILQLRINSEIYVFSWY